MCRTLWTYTDEHCDVLSVQEDAVDLLVDINNPQRADEKSYCAFLPVEAEKSLCDFLLARRQAAIVQASDLTSGPLG